MKSFRLLIFIIVFPSCVYAQQLRMGVSFQTVQMYDYILEKPMALQVGLQDTQYFSISKIRSVNKSRLSSDIPGLYMEYELKNGIFFKSDFRFSYTRLAINPDQEEKSNDTIYLKASAYFFRPVVSFETGWHARTKKLWRPFLAVGLSASTIKNAGKKLTVNSTYDYDATRFENYLSASPWYLSAQIRAGVKYGRFGASVSYQTSVSKVDEQAFIKSLNNISFLELTCDFYRSPYFSRKQYHEEGEKQDIDYTTRMSFNTLVSTLTTRWPFLFLELEKPYVDAYKLNDFYNYSISYETPPRLQVFPGIGFSQKFAISKSKQAYYYTDISFLQMRIHYAVTEARQLSQHPDESGGADLEIKSRDFRHSYTNLLWANGAGYKIRTGNRSFLYGETGLQLDWLLNPNGENDIYFLQRIIWFSQTEIGWQHKHKGINLGWMGTLNKPDKYGLYKSIYGFYIGLFYVFATS